MDRFLVTGARAPARFELTSPLAATVVHAGIRQAAGPRFGYVQALSRAPLLRLHVDPPRPGVVRQIRLVPLAEARLSPTAMRFYAESKRVSNARAKAELGWRPAYPTYREGLRAILEAER